MTLKKNTQFLNKQVYIHKNVAFMTLKRNFSLNMVNEKVSTTENKIEV